MANPLWLTQPEYCALEGISRRTFFRRQLESKVIDGTTKYAASSLSPEARAKLAGQNPDRDTRPAETSASLAPLFAPALTGHATRITLAPDAQQEAHERYEIIKPLIEYCRDPEAKARYRQLRLQDGRQVVTSDLLAIYICELYAGQGKKLSRPTLWRWKADFAKGGMEALARDVRKDKGQSRFFAKYPDAATLVAGLWLKPYQTASSAHSELLRAAESLRIPASDLPTYKTVQTYLNAIPRPIAVLARQGERAYSERMTPFIQRMFTDVQPNQIWVADHMIHDVLVRNDCFEGVDQDAQMRLRFSAFIDMRSRRFMGYCWAPEGNSRVITTAVRRGIERFGLPEIVYCDNGADYRKVAKGALPVNPQLREEDYRSLERAGALQRLGIKVQFCIPYKPQSKLIESAFRTVHSKFDALFPHYTTGNAYTKPDATIIAMGSHSKLMKMGLGARSPLIPASHFIGMATQWIENEYNAGHKHRGEGMNGMTPDQVFFAGQSVEQRRVADPNILATLLFENQKRRVRETAVTLNNRRYVAADPQSSANLHLANETDVLICYDPHDLERAIVTNLDGHRIADVKAEILLPHSADAQPAIKASMQERKRLRNATVSTVRQIHHGVTMLPHKAGLERLHEATLLQRTGTDPSIVHRLPAPPARARGKQQYAHDIANQFLSENA